MGDDKLVQLIQLSTKGNELVFSELIRHHEQQLVSLIRYQLGDLYLAEVVL